MEGQPIFWGVIAIIVAITLIAGNRRNQQTIQRVLPGSWKARWDRMTTTWNGHPASAAFQSSGETDEIWAVVEIGVSSPSRLRVKRRAFLDIQFGEPPPVAVDGPFADFEVRSDDAAFAQRLLSDPVMEKTLPLTLKRKGETITISNDTVRVARFALDDAAGDALHSAWSLATGIVTTLGLAPPRVH
jgi:hypothetical protein